MYFFLYKMYNMADNVGINYRFFKICLEEKIYTYI